MPIKKIIFFKYQIEKSYYENLSMGYSKIAMSVKTLIMLIKEFKK